MGGMPVCAAAGVATMKLIADENLVERAAERGKKVIQAIRDAKIPCVKEVRGAGFFLGIQVDKPAREVFLAALEAGLFIGPAREHVVRLAPPLTIQDDLLEKGVQKVIELLAR